MRFLKYGALALVALVLVGLATVIALDRLSQPPEVDPQQFITAAARYHARIVRDNFGVPHIFGHTDADVAFGLGFAHSEDDFASGRRSTPTMASCPRMCARWLRLMPRASTTTRRCILKSASRISCR
jgi:hypothetical protein